MKTTLDIDDHLLADAKAYAALQRKSLTRLIEEALQQRLRNAEQPTRAQPALPVFRGGTGFAPGIDPLSNKSIYDAADDDA